MINDSKYAQVETVNLHLMQPAEIFLNLKSTARQIQSTIGLPSTYEIGGGFMRGCVKARAWSEQKQPFTFI